MTSIYLFKEFDFCKGFPLGKSNFLKVLRTCHLFFKKLQKHVFNLSKA
eukprot:UN12513